VISGRRIGWVSNRGREYGHFDVGGLDHHAILHLPSHLGTLYDLHFIEGDVLPDLNRAPTSSLARGPGLGFRALALARGDHGLRTWEVCVEDVGCTC